MYFIRNEENFGPPGIACKGGGGSTGQVSFPDYMEDVHQDWLAYSGGTPTAVSKDLVQVMDAAFLTNPLDSLSYADPAADITEWETEYAAWNTEVDGLSEHTDIDTIIANAVAQVDSAGILNSIDVDTIVTAIKTSAGNTLVDAVQKAVNAIDDFTVKKIVQAFVDARLPDRASLRRRYKAGMSAIRGERSSAYAIGLALLEIDFERQTSEFEQEIVLDMYRRGFEAYQQFFVQELSSRIQTSLQEKDNRDRFMSQVTQQMIQYKQFILELRKQLATVLAELHRLKFVIDSEFVGNTADLNWKFASWDMNVYQNAINVLGGIGGSSFVPEGPSKAASAIGGALSGAGTGAAVGTAIAPGVGTAIGAGAGFVLGGLSGLL